MNLDKIVILQRLIFNFLTANVISFFGNDIYDVKNENNSSYRKYVR